MLPSMTLATRPGGRIPTRDARAPRVARFTSPAAAPALAHGQPARAVHATAAPGGADGPAGASTSSRAVPEEASSAPSSTPDLAASVTAAACLLLASAGPAWADAADAAGAADFSKGGFAKESYYVTLGLFLLSLPGLWSQVKRAPKAKRVRKVYEVPGPAVPGAMPLDARARQIFQYFKANNYEVADRGEVIKFVGTYAASRGQAAALVFYVFCGLASTALVLSIAAPFGGNNWYGLTALSPLAGVYYWQRGTRVEEFLVKMSTADDESTTDISIEGDKEEAERLCKALGLQEKGMVYVKGILG